MISVSSNIANLLRKQAADEKACWKGYTQVGMKMKGGREVPNCVPAKGVPKQKPEKEKKSAAADESSFSSESILDVPIKCTPGFGCKRYFTPQEEAEIDSASAQMWPTLFPSKGDPISSQLSSPGWSFLGHGALGALLGAGAGGGFASISQKHIPLAIALGGLVGGLGGGIYGAATKNRKNKEIINLMQELPVGADIGDVELFNDPRLKAQMARDFQRQLVRKGLMG